MDQVPARKDQYTLKTQLPAACETALAQAADGAGPAEALLDPLAKPPAHHIARMSAGTPIDCS